MIHHCALFYYFHTNHKTFAYKRKMSYFRFISFIPTKKEIMKEAAVNIALLSLFCILGIHEAARIKRDADAVADAVADADADAEAQYGGHDLYQPPKYKRICKTENSISDTTLCKPKVGKVCKPAQVQVKRPMKYPLRKCTPVVLPKCETVEMTETIEVCDHGLDLIPDTATATLVQQQNTKRCDVSYETECETPSGYKAKKEPKCHSVPRETCYDVPTIVPIEMPIDVKTADITTKDCRNVEIKIPKVICEDVTDEVCYDVPLVEDIENTNEICEPKLVGDNCEQVRLTIPYETCFYEQVHPYVYF